jgi:hypothetical protein
VSGVPWRIITGSGLEDWIYCRLFYNYKRLEQLAINDCLRLAPFLTGLRVSSLLRDWLGSDLRIGHLRITKDEWNILNWNLELNRLEWSLMLRPTVSRPVYLGMKQPSGAYDQIFITVRQLRVCWYGALSLTRGWVCRLQLLLALANAVILGSEPLGTRDRFETSLFVASYDLQGYGGVIRPHLHMGYSRIKSKSKSHCDWRSVSQ